MWGLRFLVLEDHALQRVVTARALQSMGCCCVLEASDEFEAMELLRLHGRVDIVLCGVRMMRMDSLVFMRRVYEARLVRAVVIATEMAQDLRCAIERVAMLQGFWLLGCVEKPLEPKILQRIAEQYRLGSKYLLNRVLRYPSQPTELDVQQAIIRQEFKAYFQPKISASNNMCIGAEVFVHWARADGARLLPSEFLPVVERCDLLDKLFIELLGQAMEYQRLIQREGRVFRLAFNFNILQVMRSDFPDKIKQELQSRKLSASGLVFGVTESMMLMKTSALCLENMVRLRIMGCGLSIDDFGLGYSSFGRLSAIPFNEIKLDAAFICTLMQEERYQVIANNTLRFVREQGVVVVAEKVESEAQFNFLRLVGCCDVGQGYFYAPPMSGVELMMWLSER